MKSILFGFAVIIAQLSTTAARADQYNERATQDYQQQQAQAEIKQQREFDLRRNQNNVNLVRKAVKLAGAGAAIQCYHSNGFDNPVDQFADSDYTWIHARVAGAAIVIGYQTEKIDGANCLDALFGVACPLIIAKQIEASEKPLPAPYLEVCHVNSRNKSCRVSNRDTTECH